MKKDQFLSLIIASALMVFCIGSLQLIDNRVALTVPPIDSSDTSVVQKTEESTSLPEEELARKDTQSSIEKRISFGDKTLVEREEIKEPDQAFRSAKARGIEAMAEKDYETARVAFREAIQAYRNAPETLIYLNNAEIGNGKSYTIAVAVPIQSDRPDGTDVPKEMLRGVAQSQREINEAGGINGIPLRVLIADDDSDEAVAKEVATALADNQAVLGVVGHFTSDTSLAASDVYQDRGLVMVSPTSTSVELSTKGDYIFRSLTTDNFNATALVRHMRQTLGLRKAVIFYNGESSYSSNLRDVFAEKLFVEDGSVVAEFNLTDDGFSVSNAMAEAAKEGAETIVLFHNSGVLDTALEVIKTNQPKLPVLSGDSGYKPEMLELHEYTEDILVTTVPWILIGNENSSFSQSARSLWGADVSWRTAMSYDAAQALIEAISQTDNRSGIQAALSSPSFSASGVADEIRFRRNTGDRDGAPQLVTVGKGGNTPSGYSFVPVKN